MDKRKEANIEVKMKITDAFFSLAHEKSIAEITVTEIVEKAGVARASYYRNYESKEDIAVTLIEDVLEDFRVKADYDLTQARSYRHIHRCFVYFKRYESYVLDLCHSGFSSLLLEELNQFHESIAGVMPVNSVERYTLYMYIGALFNTAVKWLQGGAKEDTREVAAAFCRYFKIPIPEKN